MINTTLRSLNRRQFLLVSGISTVAVVSGCGGGGGGTSGNNNPDLTGRTVTSGDGKASITIPDGVLSRNSPAELLSAVPSSVFAADEIGTMTSYDLSLNVMTGVKSENVITLRVPFDPTLDPNDLLIYLHDQSKADPVFALPEFSGTTASATVPSSLLIPDEARSRAVTKRIKIGVVQLRLNAKPGNVDERLYSYRANPIAGQQGEWVLDNWQSFNPGRAKRLAIIVPGTNTRRGTPQFPGIDAFQQLAAFLSTVSNPTNTNHFFDGIVAYEYDDIKAAPDESGFVLGKYLKDMLADGVALYLFAHSQGGLVSRWAIEHGGAGDVTALFMFATPNQGIPRGALAAYAWARDRAIKIATGVDSDLYRSSAALEAMSNASRDTRNTGTQSVFLNALNNSPHRANAAYYTITGAIGTLIAPVDENVEEEFANFLASTLFASDSNDGVVFSRSARGEDIDLSRYTRTQDGWDDNQHNITIEGVSHSNLPKALTNPETLRIALRGWLQDAGARIALPANVEWLDTKIDVPGGVRLIIEAAGIWTHGIEWDLGYAPEYGPDGWKIKDPDSMYLPTAKTGALIGRIGAGQPFLIGSSFAGDIPSGGRLFVTMNDAPGAFSNNDGELAVGIRVTVTSTSRAVIVSQLVLIPVRR